MLKVIFIFIFFCFEILVIILLVIILLGMMMCLLFRVCKMVLKIWIFIIVLVCLLLILIRFLILYGLKIKSSILLVKWLRLFCNVMLIVKVRVLNRVIKEVVLILNMLVILRSRSIFRLMLMSEVRKGWMVGLKFCFFIFCLRILVIFFII